MVLGLHTDSKQIGTKVYTDGLVNFVVKHRNKPCHPSQNCCLAAHTILQETFPRFSLTRDYFGINRAFILLGDWSSVITVILKWPIFARGRQPGFSGHIPVASMATVSQLAKSNQIPQHSVMHFMNLVQCKLSRLILQNPKVTVLWGWFQLSFKANLMSTNQIGPGARQAQTEDNSHLQRECHYSVDKINVGLFQELGEQLTIPSTFGMTLTILEQMRCDGYVSEVRDSTLIAIYFPSY